MYNPKNVVAWLLDMPLFLEVSPLSVSEFGKLKDVATRHLLEIEKFFANIMDVNTFHLIEHAAHLMRDDSRTCCYSID